MDTYYNASFELLQQQISTYSPQAAAQLQNIRAGWDAQAAYYAAFVLVCLQAQISVKGYRHVQALSVNQLQEFTFFHYVHDKPEALALFADIFNSYQTEQLSRFAKTG